MEKNIKEQLFRIRQWEWNQITDKIWQPDQDEGTYRVWGGVDKWVASYCFVEYYDEKEMVFNTPQEAKDWCWENWTKRLTKHLVEVNI